MDVSPQEPPLMAMDLSKNYDTRARSHHADLPKKPEWYHRDLAAPSPASCYRTRASSSSFGSLSPSQPAAAVRCRDMEPGAEPLGSYINSTITPHLELYGDGVHRNLWHPGFYGPDQGGCPAPESSGGEESDSGSDVIFLVSSAKEVCGSFLQDGVRHMVEPLSPAVSSPDDGRGCYRLTPALSSPSPDSSYSEDSSDSSVDIPVHHARPVVLLSDLAAVFGNSAESAGDVSSEDDDDDSDVVEVAVTNEKQKKRTPPGRESSRTPPPREVRRSTRIKTSPSDTPPHAGGTRHSLRRRAKNDAVGIYNESCDSDDVMEFAVRASSSDESLPPPSPPQRTGGESGQDVRSEPKSPEPPRRASPEETPNHTRKRSLGSSESTTLKRTEQQKKKKPAAQRRKKRRPRTGAAAPFPPREPEIPLRFLKAPKKEKKCQDFSPFVRMERRTCVVMNYQEDEARSGEAAAARSLSGFVPNTSCYQLGRLGSDPRGPASLRCCLCGYTANAMGLGDLHGPYCPAAAAPGALNGGVKEEESQERCHGRSVNSAHVLSPSSSPLRLDECWIHEDCSIWSAGIFLVRGKVYGLQEAARLAHDTICSTCQQMGAIMGCFQKGCARNYHHRCAVQSGCVLNEENFSMRCPEHKNKHLTATSRRRRR